MISINDLDVVFISYDEPRANEFFESLKASRPNAHRVHGIKGFDAAHLEAAKLATTPHFITIDGDNRVLPEFFEWKLSENDADLVYSYTAKNMVNGLCYGNGGVKIWPRDLVLNVRTHENGSGSDFCWTYRYFQMDQLASEVYSAQSTYHAYRSAYREAVKLSLVEDRKLGDWQTACQQMYPPNLSRLMVWASIGADIEHGYWSIYGALRGLSHVWLENLDIDLIRDYDWFRDRWDEEPAISHFMDSDFLLTHIAMLNRQLSKVGIFIPQFDPATSAWFKMLLHNGINVPRLGLMNPDMKAPVF